MSSKRILIVEERGPVAQQASDTLTRAGYELMPLATSGDEAIHYVKTNNPDLILIDTLPGGSIDGIETAVFIKQIADIPFVYLGAFSDMETLRRARETRPAGYLKKPFAEGDLLAVVETAFETARLKRALSESRQKYRNLFAESMDAVYIRTRNGRFIDVNYAMTSLLGYPRAELLRISAEELYIDPADEVRFSNDIEPKGFVKDYVVKLKKKNGSPITCIVTAHAIKTSDGICYQGIIRDISDRIQADHERMGSFIRLRAVMDGIINAIALTVESRDPYTAGHQKRVAEIAYVIGKELDLPDERLDAIKMAGMIHDLGKTSIPTEIPSRPGKISNLEYSLIKTHSRIGYDILKNIDFPWPIANIILQHHERIDGSGYPYGLGGDDMLIESRIISVADVVEAMSSHRPYRPTLGVFAALEEIDKNKGLLYDLDVVNACISAIKDGKIPSLSQ